MYEVTCRIGVKIENEFPFRLYVQDDGFQTRKVQRIGICTHTHTHTQSLSLSLIGREGAALIAPQPLTYCVNLPCNKWYVIYSMIPWLGRWVFFSTTSDLSPEFVSSNIIWSWVIRIVIYHSLSNLSVPGIKRRNPTNYAYHLSASFWLRMIKRRIYMQKLKLNI